MFNCIMLTTESPGSILLNMIVFYVITPLPASLGQGNAAAWSPQQIMVSGFP